MARQTPAIRLPSRNRALLILILSLLSGGGLGGYFNPDWPLLGPLVRGLGTLLVSSSSESPTSAGPESLVLPPGTTPPVLPGNSAGGPATGPMVAVPGRPADRLRLATFNIQVFGQSKLAKPEVMAAIVAVIRQFDIVAIQEIRSKEDNVLPQLIAQLNADGSQYDFVIGPRLGRTVSTEQYAYVFDARRVEYDPRSVGTIQDPADWLHREPMIARFRPRTAYPQQAFTFWLVNSHTDPDEVPQEVAALAQVFRAMQTAMPEEDDVILLGDLNASESELGPLAMIPTIHWVVRGGVTTNTRHTKAYDNILFSASTTTEYTGRWGVLDLETTFGLTPQQALQVSDHLPVWAEFSIWENQPASRYAERNAVSGEVTISGSR